MVFCEERKMYIPGFTIAYKVWNPNYTRPILCLHGKLDNAASFDLLAPLINAQLMALDYPGTGYSSSYQDGVIPYWKNDAFLILHLLDKLNWEKFDIVAHSLGSLLATLIAIIKSEQVGKLIFLDILGPTVNFTEERVNYLTKDAATYLAHPSKNKKVFISQEAIIQDRMKIGNISYKAAQALVNRGAKPYESGWAWTYDSRLDCVSSFVPYEDELIAMFKAINVPVCLIRAKQGVSYPDNIFEERARSIKNLTIHEVPGGHHIHMDEPYPISKIIIDFLHLAK